MGDSRKAAAEMEEMIRHCRDRIKEEDRCHLFVKQYAELHQQGGEIPLTDKERSKRKEVQSLLVDLVQEILGVHKRYELRKAMQGFRPHQFEVENG